jgi:predicted phage terminase large subunit-like protein
MTNKPSPALFNQLLSNEFPLFLRKTVSEILPSGTTFKDNWHIDAIIFALLNVFAGPSKRLIINLPPQFLKSVICSVALPAFLLGKHPGMHIMCVSYNSDLANSLHSQFLKVVQSPWYRSVFHPNIKRAVVDDYQTDEGGRRIATSVGGTVTGLPANFIIVDDPLNADDAFSESIRNATNAFCTRSLMPRLSDKKDGRMIVVMQRLHADDLTGHLLASEGNWDHLCLPALAPADRVIELPYGNKYYWKAGEALHPGFFDLDTLETFKRAIGSVSFNAQFMQEPLSADGALLKSKWLRSIADMPTKGPGDLIVQSWDTAIKDTPTSDYSVCLTFLVRGKQVFLREVFRGRVKFIELVSNALLLADKHRPDFILVEDTANGSALLQVLKIQPCPVIGVRPDKAKEARVARHTYALEADPLYVPQYAAWLDDFRTEFLAFPQGRHDDQVDALAQFYNWYEAHQRRVSFSYDFGSACQNVSAHNALLTAPSPGEILGLLGL